MISTLTRATCALVLTASNAFSQDIVTYPTQDSFDDLAFAVESAILDRGLVIDSTSHVGEMLDRTKADVGGSVDLFVQADVYSFCSASISRQVMEADPMNIAYCPYDIFVFQRPGEDGATVGFRGFPEGSMQAVQTLLDDIAREAAGL